jgi:hypothetical protein
MFESSLKPTHLFASSFAAVALCTVASLCVAVSPAHAFSLFGSSSGEEYFPLGDNNTRVFQTYDHSKGRVTQQNSQRWVRQFKHFGVNVFVREVCVIRQPENECFEVLTSRIEDRVSLVGKNDPKKPSPRDQIWPEQEFNTILTLPLKLGQCWQSRFKNDRNEWFEENNCVASIDDTISVPAGTFKNCIAISKMALTKGVLNSYTWYAPNVGIVLAQVYWSDGLLYETMLTEIYDQKERARDERTISQQQENTRNAIRQAVYDLEVARGTDDLKSIIGLVSRRSINRLDAISSAVRESCKESNWWGCPQNGDERIKRRRLESAEIIYRAYLAIATNIAAYFAVHQTFDGISKDWHKILAGADTFCCSPTWDGNTLELVMTMTIDTRTTEKCQVLASAHGTHLVSHPVIDSGKVVRWTIGGDFLETNSWWSDSGNDIDFDVDNFLREFFLSHKVLKIDKDELRKNAQEQAKDKAHSGVVILIDSSHATISKDGSKSSEVVWRFVLEDSDWKIELPIELLGEGIIQATDTPPALKERIRNILKDSPHQPRE